MTTNIPNQKNEQLIPSVVVAITAFVCAGALIAIALLGPAMLNIIHYRTSQSIIWQTQAFDITNLFLLAPLLVAGGILVLMKRDSAKYPLVLTPVMLLYSGLEYGIAQEWGNPAYGGNSEAFTGLFLALTIGGLIVLLGTLPRFSAEDTPNFNPKRLKVYVAVMAVFILMFAAMWGSQLLEVVTTGNTSTGDYLAAPTGWWMVKYIDLGVTIPLGFIALLLLLAKPDKAYPLVLLFFGFFLTLGTAVNVSALIEVINADASIVSGSGAGGLVIFPILGVLTYSGFYYLIRSKLHR